MKHAYAVISLFLILSTQIIRAQNESFKAVFVYNFMKYIEWPSEGQTTNFIIIVLGGGDIASELESITKQHQINFKNILIKKAASINEISAANIIYITKDKSAELPQLSLLATSKHFLLISEKPNSCAHGSAINFITKNSNLSFEIQKGNIEKAGLKVSAQLLKLGNVLQ